MFEFVALEVANNAQFTKVIEFFCVEGNEEIGHFGQVFINAKKIQNMLSRFISAVIIIVAGLCGLSSVDGQILYGRVKDAVTGEPISGVSLMIKETTIGTATGFDGSFKIPLSVVPAVLVVSHLSYQNLEISFASYPAGKIDISLEPGIHSLSQVDVDANKIVEIMKGKSYEILDYDFLDNNILLLANRNGSMFRPCLLLVNLYGDTISSIDVIKPMELYSDFEGSVFFLSKQSAWLVTFDGQDLELDYTMTISDFLKYYPPVVDLRKPVWLLKQYGILDQKLDYYRFTETDSSYSIFRSVVNEPAIDRASWGAYFDGTEADAHFARVIINRPVFAPLFRSGDSIIIFNYFDKQIEFYDNDGNNKGLVKASYMSRKSCEEQVFKDKVTGRYYVLFRKNGLSSLHEINITTGESYFITEIPDFVFVENIIIRNSEVFFLYKEKVGAEQKKIYRMKL